MSLNKIEVGTKIGGYQVLKSEPLPNLDARYYELEHNATRARHIHIAVDDDNNCFAVSFPTIPQDSTGVPHILEHSVLRGSERFPLNDPQSAMRSRSLNTFLNAMTSTDSTLYPFSTRVEKDYFNLLQHYLAAAFFPLLDELSFRQEGHRLEFETPDDPTSPLKFRGVVFNEMKGQMSSPPYIMFRAIGKALYPDLTYANNSGGDPAAIPDLTYEGLKAFHAKHYHPSNAYFYTYGNIPLAKTLSEIEEQALSRFEAASIDTKIPLQKDFTAPVQFRATFPLAKQESVKKKSQILISWKTVPVESSFQLFGLQILGEVLLSNAASPLRKALIDSGIGQALADGSGVVDSYREAAFSAGLKNVDESDADKIEAIVLETLESLVKDGVDQELIDAAIHQYEISTKEVSNAGFPFGLRVFFWLHSSFLYGGDPYEALHVDDNFARLAKELASGPFIEDLIRRLLLDNPHRARIILAPDQTMAETRDAEEAAKLESLQADLSEEKVSEIIATSTRLKQRQDEKEDLSILPGLGLKDVPMSFEDVAHKIEESAGARLGLFPQPTNGFTYAQITTSFESLPDDLLGRLPLFGYAVTRSGAGSDDYLKIASRIERYTGGVSAGSSVRNLASGDGFRRTFVLSSKALSRNHEPFFALLSDLFTGVHFESKRIRELIAEYKARWESMVVSAGHQYSMLTASSKLSAAASLNERLSGLTQLQHMKQMAELKEDDLDSVISDLNQIRDYLFTQGSLEICLTSEPTTLEDASDSMKAIVAQLPNAPGGALTEVPTPRLRHEAKTTSVPVAYNAKSYKVPAITHPDAPALHVLATLLQAKYLLKEIRKKGGAYGAYSLYEREGGAFHFLSYRDPHIVRTFEAFDGSLDFLRSDEADDEAVDEAILEACRAVDPLTSPDIKGRARFFDDIAGFTLELKETYKKGLFNVTKDDLVRVASEHLAGDGASYATISSAEKVAEANAAMGDIFEVSPI